jgi:tetratricopeptide (TPR) repeat protein
MAVDDRSATHSDNAPGRTPEGEDRVEALPGAIVSDLLGSAIEDDDPGSRDYGERYRFRTIIGEGGQGVVLTAYDKLLDREVALKTMKRADGALRQEYLQREARISGILEHPNIPPTYDMGADETGSPFFVMRKVNGASLDDILRKDDRERTTQNAGEARLSRIRLLSIFDQVCHAIEYAHAQGVLHLDIKPQNVRLGPYGEVFVLDWGFAARKDEQPKVIGGTPIYIAPERFEGRTPDERADIYSLGVLLYRILTGEHPFDVKELSFKEYRERYRDLAQIPPRARDATIPRELDAITMKAIAKRPGDRYQTVHALAADLQRFLDGVPVSVFRAGPFARAWKSIRRHATATILVALLVLTLGAAGALSWHNAMLQHQRQEAIQARRLRDRATVPFQKGRELIEQSRALGEEEAARPLVQTARGMFSQAISIDHGFDGAFFERGKAHMRLGAMQEALADFRQAVSLNPNRIMAHYYAGAIQMDHLKNPDAARREFEAMQLIDRENEYSNLGLARLHIMADRYREALALCERIEARNPSLGEVWDLRGYIYSKRGSPLRDPQKALAAYNRYLATPSQNASAYGNRGDVRRELGDVDGALADYSAALAINPDYVYALSNRGYLRYAEKRDIDGALEDLNRAVRVDPEHYWTYMDLGAVHEYLGQWAEAEEHYNWAYDYVFRRQGRVDATIPLRIAECFFKQRKFDDALTTCTEAVGHAAGTEAALALHLRGLIRYASGGFEPAKADFARAAEGHPHPFFPAAMQYLATVRTGEMPDPTPLQTLAEAEESRPWLAASVEYWRGLVTAEEAFDAAPTPVALCQTAYYTGMAQLLLEEDPEAARATLMRAVETGRHLQREHVLARVALDRLPPRPEQPQPADPATESAPESGPGAAPEPAREPEGE